MKDLFTFSKIRRCVSASLVVVFVVGIVSSSLMSSHKAYATVSQPKASPLISFTFDDGLTTALTNAEPTLAQYGLTGTDYVISGCVGMTTEPNTCNANNDTTYMTWAQIKTLAADGWEIGDHTVDHDCLASSAETDPSDCANPAPLTTAQVDTELSASQAAILANTGISPTDMAPPYGDYNNNVMAQIAKYYSSMRQFKNAATNANVWPYSDYYLQDMVVQEGTDPVSTVETAINSAITNNQWLILTFHNIETKASTNPDDYEYNTSELAQIAAYVQSKESTGLRSVTVNQGLETSSINFLNNGSFKDGIADGWTTDNPTAVTHDTADNGAFPDPTDSIKFTSSATAAHLFSPKVNVDSTKTYGIKSFLNVQSITSGEIGYYIDEYDASGNWISGQWKTAENSAFVENMNFSYTPSSANVKSAALQIYTTANSGITAYVDNVQWFALDGSSPITTTPPTTTNVMPNSTFDNGGISDGWSTDNSTAFVADSSNHGDPDTTADQANSIKLTAPSGTANAHLFSPKISVASGTTYTIEPWTNLTTLNSGGELGLYVDEYNASGTWISGKYLTGVRVTGPTTTSVSYTPSSASVTQASLQIILVGGSGLTGYLDNAQWLTPGPVTPPPTSTTLLAENFTNGFDGWTNDSPTSFTADTSGADGGSNPDSIKFVAPTTATNVHLFSPKVTVSSAKSYTIGAYVNVNAITSGEVAFYVDEYNSSGTWISGKYIKGITTAGSQTVSLGYTPSSASVASASLQFIVEGNTGITGYITSINWANP